VKDCGCGESVTAADYGWKLPATWRGHAGSAGMSERRARTCHSATAANRIVRRFLVDTYGELGDIRLTAKLGGIL